MQLQPYDFTCLAAAKRLFPTLRSTPLPSKVPTAPSENANHMPPSTPKDAISDFQPKTIRRSDGSRAMGP